MSTYQFFIILHGLKDVLVWLVPLVIAALLCVTAVVIAFRWIHQRSDSSAELEALAKRLEEVEHRLAALEERANSDAAADIRGNEAAAE